MTQTRSCPARPGRARIRLLPLLLLLAACAHLPPAGRAPPARPGAPWRRLEFALLEDYDKGDDLERVRADFRVMHDLGIHTWRGSFGWDDYEPRPGVYDFAWLRQFVTLAGREGIRLRPYLGYTPAWAGGGGHDKDAWNDPPRSMQQWQDFVRHIAGEFARSPVASWEIYNEENAPQWFDGTVQQYGDVLAAAASAIRAVAPRTAIVLGGLTWPDAAWLAAICRRDDLRRDFDVAALHVYAETWPREKRVEDAVTGADYRQQFLPTLHRDCGGQPLWINETGFATSPGRTEAEQAAWWARAIATFAADSAVSMIGVYETREPPRAAGVIGEAENYYLGIRYQSGAPKLAYRTVKLMVGLLTGPYRVLDPVPGAGGDVVAHLFRRRDGRAVLLAWTRGQATTRRFDLGAPARRLTLYSVAGFPVGPVPFTGSSVELRLTPGDVVIVTTG